MGSVCKLAKIDIAYTDIETRVDEYIKQLDQISNHIEKTRHEKYQREASELINQTEHNRNEIKAILGKLKSAADAIKKLYITQYDSAMSTMDVVKIIGKFVMQIQNEKQKLGAVAQQPSRPVAGQRNYRGAKERVLQAT